MNDQKLKIIIAFMAAGAAKEVNERVGLYGAPALEDHELVQSTPLMPNQHLMTRIVEMADDVFYFYNWSIKRDAIQRDFFMGLVFDVGQLSASLIFDNEPVNVRNIMSVLLSQADHRGEPIVHQWRDYFGV